MGSLDVVASRVSGLVNARDVRVVYSGGKLYIAKTPADIQVFTADEPKKSGGAYTAKVGESSIRFALPTCGSCKRRVMASPVGQMSVEEIVLVGESVDA